MGRSLQLFAEILDYPGQRLFDDVHNCISSLEPGHREAVRLLGEFRAELEGAGVGRLEEVYTATFDLQAGCSLYAGYHLFGDDYRRSVLLVKLKESYRVRGFSTGKELPDHLCVLLRFLALHGHEPESLELVSDCVIPALSKMVEGAARVASPYRLVLEALLQWFRAAEGPCETGGTTTRGGKENMQ
jgi:nitrate reductase molybdenum cofactor assembly chaperone NarJ/NarW